ncbi:MAG: flavin reductase family protein [bacterium]
MEKIIPAEQEPADMSRLFYSLIAPRPVVLVTTLSQQETLNCAPFSFFQVVCANPPLVSLSITRPQDDKKGRKDTLRNALLQGQFVVHMVREENLEQVKKAGEEYPPETSEVRQMGLQSVPSNQVRVPGIKGLPVRMECKLRDQLALAAGEATVLFGEVVELHLSEEFTGEDLTEINLDKLNPLLHTGPDSYTNFNR